MTESTESPIIDVCILLVKNVNSIHGRMKVRINLPCLHEQINSYFHTGSAPPMRNRAAKQRLSPVGADFDRGGSRPRPPAAWP